MIPGVWVTVTSAKAGSEVARSLEATAKLTMAAPLSMSACVTGRVAVPVVEAPAANVVDANVTGKSSLLSPGVALSSVTDTLLSGTSPVLVTV